MNKKITFLIALIMAITINGLIGIDYGIADRITKEKAIEIANSEAEKLGYDVESMSVEATKYSNPWNEYVPKDNKEYAAERNQLKNKQYWAVYYAPMGKHIKGGDLCIFVDYNTGMVITKIRWK